ncbi:hypothetical protein ABLT31_32220 [Ammoniphilus sp. 3BR4]
MLRFPNKGSVSHENKTIAKLINHWFFNDIQTPLFLLRYFFLKKIFKHIHQIIVISERIRHIITTVEFFTRQKTFYKKDVFLMAQQQQQIQQAIQSAQQAQQSLSAAQASANPQQIQQAQQQLQQAQQQLQQAQTQFGAQVNAQQQQQLQQAIQQAQQATQQAQQAAQQAQATAQAQQNNFQ